MEVRRLLTALNVVKEDFELLTIQQQLAALQSAATTLASSPADPSANDNFVIAHNQILATLQKAEANTAAVSIRSALKEVRLDSLIGANLLSKLNQIFEAKPFLIPPAAQAIQALVQEVKQSLALLNKAITALKELGFEPEDIAPQEYELGVLMPDGVTKNDLKTIQDQIEKWIRVVETIERLVNGVPPAEIKVRSLSSGSFDLFLSIDPKGAYALLILASGVYGIFRAHQNVVKKREELEADKIPQDVIEGMKRYEKDLIEKGKQQTLEYLLKHKAENLQDLPELETSLKNAIRFVLKSVNHGVDVEVSTPPEDDTEAPLAVQPDIKQLKSDITKLRLEMTDMTLKLPDRSKPMLQLTDGAEATEDEEKAEEKSPKAAKHSKKN
jgi:hypothetical protein